LRSQIDNTVSGTNPLPTKSSRTATMRRHRGTVRVDGADADAREVSEASFATADSVVFFALSFLTPR
jgi:hypothetical protein